MLRTIRHRLLLTIPVLFGTSIIVFGIVRLVPGSPAAAILGPDETPALVATLNRQLGLDRPIYIQYARWIAAIFHGNLGYDYADGQSVVSEITSRVPVTVELVVVALLMAIVVGVPLGIVAAVRRDRAADRVVRAISVLSVSVPDFALGILLILAFSLGLRLFPASGFVPISQSFGTNVHSIILPAAALAAGLAGVLMRITRSSLLEVLDRDYIRFCRATGIGEGEVVLRHALRNAALPIVTVAGLQLGYLLGATVVVEQVFSLPGLGSLLVQSMLNRDYPVVQGSVLMLVLAFILINLAVDLTGTVLNPKLRR